MVSFAKEFFKKAMEELAVKWVDDTSKDEIWRSKVKQVEETLPKANNTFIDWYSALAFKIFPLSDTCCSFHVLIRGKKKHILGLDSR
jgi:hypothetical protein